LAAVRRRKIFYISGFDPRGAAFYHSLFRDEAKLQCALSGDALDISRRRRDGPLRDRWDANGQMAGQPVSNEYVFLRWDDLIRQQWARALPAIVGQAFSTVTAYARNGVLRRMYREHLAGFQTVVYTAVLMMALALAAVALGGLAAWGASAGLGWTLWPTLASGLAVMLAVLCTWPLIEKSLNPLWASRATTFLLDQGNSRVAGLDERLNAFADQIVAAAQAGEHDEILVVAHSSGVQLAVSTMALALGKCPQLGRQGAPVSLLTLGGCIPLLVLVPQAQFFRDRLKTLVEAGQICWVDFNQVTDWICWSAPDLLAMAGIEAPPGAPRPLAHSPRIHTLFSAQRYEALKRDRLRLHFQYLMAGEKLGEYDFFAIACGPVALSERFAHPAAESTQLP
jgi:hypothetical protein